MSLRDEALTPMEQIKETQERYVDALRLAGMTVSPSQATAMRDLAEQLAWLHEQEAAECRQRAEFWRTYMPPVQRVTD